MMAFNDLFTDSKADTRTTVFILMVQALEKHEYLFKKDRFDANPVVLDTEYKIPFFFPATDVDTGRRIALVL
jgi:hypothetical protein